MDKEKTRSELMKHARNAFETACTLRDDERIEVYLNDGVAKSSDVLDEGDEIVYGPTRQLCYQVYGHDYLEEEIVTWIDYARIIKQPTDEAPMPEPTDIELSIRELIDELAQKHGAPRDRINSYEVFANLSMDLLGTIEQKIIEYWWDGDAEENGKTLAAAQIDEALVEV